jgi:hypothetical protein
VQEVDRVLQRGGKGVVVLRRDEDEGVGGVDGSAPLLGVIVLVVA